MPRTTALSRPAFVVYSGKNMTFTSELTHLRAIQDKNEGQFHSNYEKAMEEQLEDLKKPQTYQNVFGGKYVKGKKTFDKFSPNDKRMLLGKFPLGSASDVNAAVKAAGEAFPEWSKWDYTARVAVFERIVKLFREHKYELSAAITLDNGKNRDEAVADVDEAIDFMSYYADQVRTNEGYRLHPAACYEDERPVSVLRPYGVWAVVCPFNFPIAIGMGMASAAMITGNTVVIKPSSLTPFAFNKAFQLLDEAGLPPGVANLITGPGGEVGDALVTHPNVEGVVFTGSKDVGFNLIRNSVRGYPRPVIAEMGSKNAVIVTSNANVEKAVDAVIKSAFGYSGQKCSACSRLLVDSGMKKEFESLLVEKANRLVISDPAEKACDLGPIIEDSKAKEFLANVTQGKKDGKVLCGGNMVKKGKMANGNYLSPTIISGLPDSHELIKKELFMPILCTQGFKTLEEAVKKANSSVYGLTGGIFSDDEVETDYYFDNVQSGVVYANRRRGGSTGAMVGSQSFVGWKASGSTGKGTGGPYYLQQFMREQAQTVVI
jgi:1-pyrroline-5-carboxylate dehydrogenase